MLKQAEQAENSDFTQQMVKGPWSPKWKNTFNGNSSG